MCSDLDGAYAIRMSRGPYGRGWLRMAVRRCVCQASIWTPSALLGDALPYVGDDDVAGASRWPLVTWRRFLGALCMRSDGGRSDEDDSVWRARPSLVSAPPPDTPSEAIHLHETCGFAPAALAAVCPCLSGLPPTSSLRQQRPAGSGSHWGDSVITSGPNQGDKPREAREMPG